MDVQYGTEISREEEGERLREQIIYSELGGESVNRLCQKALVGGENSEKGRKA